MKIRVVEDGRKGTFRVLPTIDRDKGGGRLHKGYFPCSLYTLDRD